MQVIIIKQSKSPTQSGYRSNIWCIKGINPIGSKSKSLDMGWTSSSDMSNEIHLEFSSKKDAEQYCENNLMEYETIESLDNDFQKKSYSDNFLRKK